MVPVHASCLLDHLLQMHLGPWGCKNPLLLILEEERKTYEKEEIIKIFKNLNGIGDCIFKNPYYQGDAGLGVMLLFAQLLDQL